MTKPYLLLYWYYKRPFQCDAFNAFNTFKMFLKDITNKYISIAIPHLTPYIKVSVNLTYVKL